jgi:hypothetical protein
MDGMAVIYNIMDEKLSIFSPGKIWARNYPALCVKRKEGISCPLEL